MSFAVVATAAAVGGAAYSIYAGERAAGATRDAAARQRAIDEMNAQLIEKDATNVEVYGQTEMASYDPTIRATVASQQAAFAQDNVDVSYGTAAVIQKETELTGLLNKLEIQNQARQKAAGLRQQAKVVRAGGDARQETANAEAGAQQRAGYGQAIQIGMSYYGRK